ncbi:hypothetical protein GGP41_006349 [Bipolaris sorokiniana]|uniref:AAA+ ATPase domain-containing protein n=1 Tax=Cochliobolus sativus TaxID=45130 RepID=A0A8H6DWT3_COCSA|nr:hypothetical protein GGP41_006349 [Bipolaris sorokiniana]
MNAIPGSSEPRTLFRDSGVGMPPTDSANVDSSKEEVVSEQKETEVCAIDGIARDNEEEEPEEVTYEIRYEIYVASVISNVKKYLKLLFAICMTRIYRKVVDVRRTWLEIGASDFYEQTQSDPKGTAEETENRHDKTKDEKNFKLPPFESHRGSYIEITSPAVLEALRCVVDYAPGYDLGARKVRIDWPYSLLVHHEDALAKYQERFATSDCIGGACPGTYAYRHISIVRNFVKAAVGAAVRDERERHARGMATFDMLWLLFPPGIDVLYDGDNIGEYQPHVIRSHDCVVVNETVRAISFELWNMAYNVLSIGPSVKSDSIQPFAGEVKINSLAIYPFEYCTQSKKWGEKEDAKQYFEERGKIYFQLRRPGCWNFRGYTTSFPQNPIEGLVIADDDRYNEQLDSQPAIKDDPETDYGQVFDRHCCDNCRETISSQRKPYRFSGYSNINFVSSLGMTDHQYFLCDDSSPAYVLKQRQWCHLDVAGFRPVKYDKSMIDTLVMKEPRIKQLIQGLTRKYLLGLQAEAEREAEFGRKVTNSKTPALTKQWSPDFVKGKGEGLIFLLHGKPGVGKTYTAECIAANAERPLLTVTCADIGTDPLKIEENLLVFFKYAKAWNAILLIDEADIFMEHRRVQDIERNSLVASFLRAMEYYQGILFLTTNRVGMFDEAFISRINLTIYYPPFSDKARAEVWESFFQKLEREREGEIRVHNNTRAYIEECKELKALQWNGREIRNAFQIAVSLAETDEERDNRGCIVIKQKHIEATVEMSRSFKKYLNDLYRKDEDAVAALRGNRNDPRPNAGDEDEEEYH